MGGRGRVQGDDELKQCTYSCESGGGRNGGQNSVYSTEFMLRDVGVLERECRGGENFPVKRCLVLISIL